MRLRTVSTALFTPVLIAGISLTLDTPAQAATFSTDCTAPTTQWFTLALGETLTITTTNTGNCHWLDSGTGNAGSMTYGTPTGAENILPPDTWTEITPGDTVIYSAAGMACGTTTAVGGYEGDGIYLTPDPTVDLTFITIGVVASGPPCATPPDVLQQVGAPADGSCATISAPDLNIGGAGSGGWGRSWAQWAHDGQGGEVCTRTLTYNQNVAHYVVAQ